MKTPIHDLLSADHARLDGALARSLGPDGKVDAAAFAEFRAGLARHIGMEEKILFPAARRRAATDDEALADLAKLRADHGRLVALLVPTPTAALIESIRAILVPHNELEEREGGVYAACEALIGDEAERIAAELADAPEVPMRPHYDGPAHTRPRG